MHIPLFCQARPEFFAVQLLADIKAIADRFVQVFLKCLPVLFIYFRACDRLHIEGIDNGLVRPGKKPDRQ